VYSTYIEILIEYSYDKQSFRTTDDNCVDTAEADEERSEEAKSWRDWTGIGTLYCGLARLNHVQVHVLYCTGTVHSIGTHSIHCTVECELGTDLAK
jgi:hypothetical protein